MSQVQAWRWRLTAERPPITAAIQVGVAARATVLSKLQQMGEPQFPDEFHRGRDPTHSHAYWLPEDEDADGWIDHIIVFSEIGIEPHITAALAATQAITVGAQRLILTPAWMGGRVTGGLFGPAATWRSVTPYVTPKWQKNKAGKERPSYAPEAQLRSEIAARREAGGSRLFADPDRVELSSYDLVAGRKLVALEFDRIKGQGLDRYPPGDARPVFAEVRFPHAVWGPLAFGFGCHFGLGLFQPIG